ncbi:MAG TPA: SCP2 sterol-binding domain-containing protein [Povalibacter sp.]|nr:SCP2 sterol-binding domain-containing protein [Povalibacter sp.]
MPPIPSPLHRLLRFIPTPAHEHLVASILNQALRGQPLRERLGELTGKRIRLCVVDVPLTLTFEIVNGGLQRSSVEPHVTLRGTWHDFLALARRREDPDTLFFQRRLAVEGETETGLHLKNLLDGWDYDVPAHVRAVLPGPLATLTLALGHGARVLHSTSRLRRPGSHRNSRQAGRAPG